jgi:hypothetical protein
MTDGNENHRVMMLNWRKGEHDLWEERETERTGYYRAPRQWKCTRKNIKI